MRSSGSSASTSHERSPCNSISRRWPDHGRYGAAPEAGYFVIVKGVTTRWYFQRQARQGGRERHSRAWAVASKTAEARRGWRHDVGELAAQSAFDHPTRVLMVLAAGRGVDQPDAYIVQKGGTGESLHGHSSVQCDRPTNARSASGRGIAAQSVARPSRGRSTGPESDDPTHLAPGGLSDYPKRAVRAAEVGPIDHS